MKHIKLFEQFNESGAHGAFNVMSTYSKTLEEKILKHLDLPEGYDAEYDEDSDRISIVHSNGDEIGYVEIGGIEEFDDEDLEDKKYIVIEGIFLTEEHRKEELFDAILDAVLKYAEKSDRADGVISMPVDLETEKIKRSEHETNFWENRAKKNKAVKYPTTAGDMYTIEI